MDYIEGGKLCRLSLEPSKGSALNCGEGRDSAVPHYYNRADLVQDLVKEESEFEDPTSLCGSNATEIFYDSLTYKWRN